MFTIAEEDSAPSRPSCENLFLQRDLRNQFLVRPVKKVSNRQRLVAGVPTIFADRSNNREINVTGLVAYGCRGVRVGPFSAFVGLELLFHGCFGRGFFEVLQDHPCKSILFCREHRNLFPSSKTKRKCVRHEVIFSSLFSLSHLIEKKNKEKERTTYRVRMIACKGQKILTTLLLQDRKHFWIQRPCLSNKTSTTKRQILLIRFWQSTLLLQRLIHSLSNSTVSTICANKDITLKHPVVGGLDHHLAFLFQNVDDSSSKEDLGGGDLL